MVFFLPSFLPSFLTSFRPSVLPSFLFVFIVVYLFSSVPRRRLLWGVSHVFYCGELKAYFMAGDYFRRLHHPGPTVTGNGRTLAPADPHADPRGPGGAMYHGCCGQLANALNVRQRVPGCTFTEHRVDPTRAAVSYVSVRTPLPRSAYLKLKIKYMKEKMHCSIHVLIIYRFLYLSAPPPPKKKKRSGS